MGQAQADLSGDRPGPIHRTVPALGGAGSRALGAGRLRDRGRRHARQRQVAGLSRSAPAAREPGLLRADRMGRHAALVERQGRAARHFLSRHQPVEGRRAAAAAPRCDLPVGGALGSLPRRQPSRRHLQQLLHHRLVAAAGAVEPARQRQDALLRPGHRRTLDRAGAERGDARRQSRGSPRQPPAPQAQRPVAPVAHAAHGQGEGAAAVRRQLGRARRAPARQRLGLRRGRLEAEVAVDAHRHALRELLSARIRRHAETVLRSLSEGHRQRLGPGAAGPHRGARRARQGDRAQGERVAARQDAMDEVPSRRGEQGPRPATRPRPSSA